METFNTLDPSPFKNMVMTVGNLPTSFVASMSYYEALAWLCNYLQTEVIPTVNNNSEVSRELQEKFVELKEFVDNYFENLDVQEEINNKLDDMAESGELEEIIVNYLSDSVKIIFPDYGKDGTDTLGDCSIIKTANKAVMIDCFSDDATCWGRITEALYQNNITKLDYFILTHYDADHYGNYERLIASGLIDDATIILPRSVVRGDINKTGNDIKEALTTAGLSYEIADNETLNIETNVSLKLFNASSTDYAHYDEIEETNYNNYSVCAELDAFGKKVLFTGDILESGEEYVAANYLSSNYELVKDSHHGFNAFVNEYGRKVAPKYVLVPASNGMIQANLGYRGNVMLANWSLYTPFIYILGIQDNFVSFTVGNGGTKVNAGSVATQQAMGGTGNYTFRVDYDHADDLRIGSNEHPFKTLAEASLLTPKTTNKNINIQVYSLGNETSQVDFSGYTKLSINFQNHAPKHLITFNDIHDLRLTNVALSDSVIEINDCSGVINGVSSSYATSDQITIARSKIHFMGELTSTGATTSFIKATYSDLTFAITSLTYTQSDSSARIFNIYGDNITMNTTSTTVFAAYGLTSVIATKSGISQCQFNNLTDLATLFTSASNAYADISLAEDIDNYDYVKIVFATSDNYLCENEFPVDTGTVKTYLLNRGMCNSGITEFYVYTARIKLEDTTATISRNAQITIKSTGNTIASGDKIGIRKIIGIIK